VLRCPIPWAGRLRLLRAVVAETEIDLAPGLSVWLCDGIDRRTFDDVFIHRNYIADYEGATLLDLGAHKGYSAAWALVHGAVRVISVEPAAANYAYLERSSAGFNAADRFGREWVTVRAAVSDEAGRARLHLSAESWTHALTPPPADTGRTEEVDLVPLLALLEQTEGAARLIVKVDCEGVEQKLLAAMSPAAWRRADSVFMEVHDDESWRSAIAFFPEIGFRLVGRFEGGVVRAVREAGENQRAAPAR
jgi:FkbM family methyltransferase